MEDDVKQSSADRYVLSQAYRWRAERDKAMQELRQLKDRSRDTTMSVYDLLPQEDREALRWVRGHGGLDEVRRDFQDAYNRRSELCAALGIGLDTGWSDAMAELDSHLMPEGIEWPRFEDGEPVKLGDSAAASVYGCTVELDSPVDSITFYDDGTSELCGDMNTIAFYPGERVKRPESWERIEADAMMDAKVYCESRGISPEYPKHNGKAKCEDIVRRCKALAGVSE